MWQNLDDDWERIDSITALDKSCQTPTENFHTEIFISVFGNFTNFSKTVNSKMPGVISLPITLLKILNAKCQNTVTNSFKKFTPLQTYQIITFSESCCTKLSVFLIM